MIESYSLVQFQFVTDELNGTIKKENFNSQAKDPEFKEPLEALPSMDKSKRVPKTTHREFGGASGSFFMLFLLPVTVYGLNIMCDKVSFI